MQIFNVGSNGVNLYLIDSDSHRLLIDTGFPHKTNDLGRALRKTGFKIGEVDYLMVTHFHIDHAGAVQELKEEGVKFILFELQIPFIEPMEKMALGKWNYVKLQMEDNLVLKIDESEMFLHSIGLQGRVLFTPGHSDDSVTLLLDSGETFIGDLSSFSEITDKTGKTFHSWRKLRKAPAKRIYPGHGNDYVI